MALFVGITLLAKTDVLKHCSRTFIALYKVRIAHELIQKYNEIPTPTPNVVNMPQEKVISDCEISSDLNGAV